MNTGKPAEDLSELMIDVEVYKKRIEELDCNNHYTSEQCSKLTDEIKDKEAAFNSKVYECLHKHI